MTYQGRTTRSETFKLLQKYSSEKEIDRKYCVGVCTDYRSGVVAKAKEVAHKEMLFRHCIIHREHWALKKLSPDLKKYLLMLQKLLMQLEVKLPTPDSFKHCLIKSMDLQRDHLLHAKDGVTKTSSFLPI